MKKFLLLLAAVLFISAAGCSYQAEISDSTPQDTVPTASVGIESIRTPEDIMARNSAIVREPIILPDDALRLYISTDPSRVEEVLRQVKQTSDIICAGLDSDYSKLYAISQWVSKNLFYDKDAAKDGVTDEMITLDYILETRRTVCLGFANFTAALCCAQGMDCRVVHGRSAPTDSNFIVTEGKGNLHEWTVVIMDGREVWVDALWNTSNIFFRGEYYDRGQHTRYFDMPAITIANNHRADRCEIRDYFSLLSD